MSVSVNSGQHWLASTTNYTYFCNDLDFYIDPAGSGACLSCPKGGKCNGGPNYYPMDGYWRSATRPHNSQIYPVSKPLPSEGGHQVYTLLLSIDCCTHASALCAIAEFMRVTSHYVVTVPLQRLVLCSRAMGHEQCICAERKLRSRLYRRHMRCVRPRLLSDCQRVLAVQ